MIRAWLASQSLNASMLVGGQGADGEAEDLVNVDLTLAVSTNLVSRSLLPNDTIMNLSNFNVTQPSDLPVMKVTSSLAVLLHFRLVPIMLAV